MKQKPIIICLQIVLALAICGLGYVVYRQIAAPIEFQHELNNRRKAVITRLKSIRTAEQLFKMNNNRFTADWDTLTNFALYDSIVMERKKYDEDDSVQMAKLAKTKEKNIEYFKVAVKDSLHISDDDIKNMRYIPFTDDTEVFSLSAGTLTTESKVVVPVVECSALYIKFLDTVKYRQDIVNFLDEEKQFNREPFIKFGSMETANNEAGNWED